MVSWCHVGRCYDQPSCKISSHLSACTYSQSGSKIAGDVQPCTEHNMDLDMPNKTPHQRNMNPPSAEICLTYCDMRQWVVHVHGWHASDMLLLHVVRMAAVWKQKGNRPSTEKWSWICMKQDEFRTAYFPGQTVRLSEHISWAFFSRGCKVFLIHPHLLLSLLCFHKQAIWTVQRLIAM